MTTTAVEYDARPGVVHDAVADAMSAWLRLLESEIALARDQGEIHPALTPADTPFAVNALAIAANILFQLHDDRQAFQRAKLTIEQLLEPPTE